MGRYRRLTWQRVASFLWNGASSSHPPLTPFHAQWARPVNCQNREIPIFIEVKSSTSTLWNVVGAERTAALHMNYNIVFWKLRLLIVGVQSRTECRTWNVLTSWVVLLTIHKLDTKYRGCREAQANSNQWSNSDIYQVHHCMLIYRDFFVTPLSNSLVVSYIL
jgi:hypothetical protein